MSTPIGHSLAGVSICFLTSTYLCPLQGRGLRRGWKSLLFCAIIACLPDIDFLPGIFVGNINYYHHKGTHSIFFALVMSLAVWAVARGKNRVKWGFLTFILILSHLAIDYITIDLGAPFGIPLLWPFSGKYFCFQNAFLPSTVRSASVASVFNAHNLRVILSELIIYLPLAIISYVVYRMVRKRSR